jgi:hypothetical protein
MADRASNKTIIVVSNSLGEKLVDMASRADKRALVFDESSDQYIHIDLIEEGVTFETLFAKDDVGPGSDQLAQGNHDHDVGDLTVLFDNKII